MKLRDVVNDASPRRLDEDEQRQSWKHDVFLSFRGRDTRNNFTAHLWCALNRRGIKAYKDDNELVRGDSIEPSLFEAIEGSRFSIVVFSENYASSPWCLDELVKVAECRRPLGHTVYPVFYDADPTDEDYQERAFRGLPGNGVSEEDLREKVKIWKGALNEVGGISGWDARNKDQAETITKIAEHIWDTLKLTPQTIIEEDLVGLDSREKEVSKLIDGAHLDSNDVRIIEICGTGGIGKTKLARVVYNKQQARFPGRSCFLPNVRESIENHGTKHLQKLLLSQILPEKNISDEEEEGKILIQNRLHDKAVLIVLDDVSHPQQLEALVGKNWNWLGQGSRLIITSKMELLVKSYGYSGSDDDVRDVAESAPIAKKYTTTCKVYNLEKLSDNESLRLFSQKAFNQREPREGYEELSNLVLGYCLGLPLAIEVLGCFVRGKSKAEWESVITLLKERAKPEAVQFDRGVFEVIKVSLGGLSKHERNMFLDIACFFKGKDVSDAKRILASCGFSVDIGLKILSQKSLLVISNGKLEMHDLLQEVGREMVRKKFPNNPGKHSRLWSRDDAFHVLDEATGEKKVKAIVLDLPNKDGEQLQCDKKAFSKMSKLRLLIVHNVVCNQGPKDLSTELKFLDWDGYPSKSLPTSFRPKNLVELSLTNSNIRQLGCGKKKDFSNLKIMNLSHSHNLTKTPDFTAMQKLERLILEDCTSLSEIHPSIGTLQKLIHLNLSGCNKITKLPIGIMESLQELLLDGTNIQQLPESICSFGKLSTLSLKDCKSLHGVPKNIANLSNHLKILDISGCPQLDKEQIENTLNCLKILH
ncbi:unnamed protein product [Linum trigynum]|uniref:TIR domain-containing protein n=1 Tax=Linum trigynum TaxID=586398 RepID=A0AAV2D1D1_9ROSI